MGKPRHEQSNALAITNKKLVCRGKGNHLIKRRGYLVHGNKKPYAILIEPFKQSVHARTPIELLARGGLLLEAKELRDGQSFKFWAVRRIDMGGGSLLSTL